MKTDLTWFCTNFLLYFNSPELMLREQLDAYQDWTISASGGRWHNFLRDSRELKYARKNIYIYRFLVGYEVLIWAIAVIWLKKYTWSASKIFRLSSCIYHHKYISWCEKSFRPHCTIFTPVWRSKASLKLISVRELTAATWSPGLFSKRKDRLVVVAQLVRRWYAQIFL